LASDDTIDSIMEEAREFFAAHPEVKFIRILWMDYVATLRGRVLTASHFGDLIRSGRFHEGGRCYVTLPDDSGPWYEKDPSCAVGKLSLVPDLSTLKLVPGYDQHAAVMCYIGDDMAETTDILESGNSRIRASPLCPRTALLAVARAAAQQKIEILVGIEVEFVVFTTDSDGHAIALDIPAHQATSMRTLERHMLPILDDIVLALGRAGIQVQHYQSEGAPAQYEIALAPLSPLMAADAFVMTRECIRTLCQRHGLTASLHPWCALLGSGLHVHISADGPGHGTGERKSFLAGIMQQLPALCALGMTTPMSYKRTAASMCGCGGWVAWGTQNRQTAVRAISDNHWELKAIDGLSNIYLAIAAYLQCGLGGVADQATLVQQDCLGEFSRPDAPHRGFHKLILPTQRTLL
jgi:glutamine synthetase